MVRDFAAEFNRYRLTGEKAIDQLSDDSLNRVIGENNNSIAVIVRHVSGNLISRFTDFLCSDGEKSWRNRDAEFECRHYSRQQVLELWQRAWNLLDDELSRVTDGDLQTEVRIRGQALTVQQALLRSMAHVAYHVGQIVTLARIEKEDRWDWISIPRGKSEAYNQKPTMEKKPE